LDKEKATILVIEDHEAFRDILVKILTLNKYRVIAVDLGSQGLEVAAREKPDVIILDIMMPELDGYETCRELRKLPDLADVRIIMLTALSVTEVRARALAAGANACLSKPCPIDVLEEIIERNLTPSPD
jgi:CheY-like chemotaxis protein